MAFWQQVLATMIGATAGFLFSLALFFLKDHLALRKYKKAARKNLVREFLYNIKLLDGLAAEVTKAIERVSADDRANTYFLTYERYQRYFMQQSYTQGLLFDYFDAEEVTELQNVSFEFLVGTEAFVNQKMEAFKKGTVDKAEMVGILDFERDRLQKAKPRLNKLAKKLQND